MTAIAWTQHAGPYVWKAHHFAVGDYGEGRIVAWWIPVANYPRKLGEYTTVEDAKAACQAKRDQLEEAAASAAKDEPT